MGSSSAGGAGGENNRPGNILNLDLKTIIQNE